jgi:excisionase family DNA binding protein
LEQIAFHSIGESLSVRRAPCSPPPDTCGVEAVCEVLAKSADVLTQPVRDNLALLSVEQVAKLLSCSTRHVYRLADRGAMPPPVKVGALVRWRRQTIEEWITNGCKPCRTAGR